MGIYPCTHCGAPLISATMTQQSHADDCPRNDATQALAASIVHSCSRVSDGTGGDGAKGSMFSIGFESMRDEVAKLLAEIVRLRAQIQ